MSTREDEMFIVDIKSSMHRVLAYGTRSGKADILLKLESLEFIDKNKIIVH